MLGNATGLAENRCLETRPGGAQLLQVGEQEIALGAKFRATVVLDIQVTTLNKACLARLNSLELLVEYNASLFFWGVATLIA